MSVAASLTHRASRLTAACARAPTAAAMHSKCARPHDHKEAREREGFLVTVRENGKEFKRMMRQKVVRVEEPASTSHAPPADSTVQAAVAAKEGAGDAAPDASQQPAAPADGASAERWADHLDEATTVAGDGDVEEEEPDPRVVGTDSVRSKPTRDRKKKHERASLDAIVSRRGEEANIPMAKAWGQPRGRREHRLRSIQLGTSPQKQPQQRDRL